MHLSIFMSVILSSFLSANQLKASERSFDLVKTVVSSDGAGKRSPVLTCKVFSGQMEIERALGFDGDGAPLLLSQQTIQVRMPKILQTIERAAGESLIQIPNHLCGLHIDITAYLGDGAPVVIYSSVGCDKPLQERDGPNARALNRMMSNFCPIP